MEEYADIHKEPSYYSLNKATLNYDRKLNYNKNKYSFISDKDDAEKWIKFRKFILPFGKVLQVSDDVDEVTTMLYKYLNYLHEKNSDAVL